MIKKILYLIFIFVISSNLNANENMAKTLVNKLSLSAGSKAIKQWERIFTSAKKMKRYKIDKLSSRDKEILKEYLISHAIDSDQPTVAGI
jgi:hypothetical protein